MHAEAAPPEPRSGVGGLSLSSRELRLGKPAPLRRNIVLRRTDRSQILLH